MRFGRILLASLTALAAYSYTQQAPELRHAEAFPKLFHVVVPLFAAVADATTTAPVAKTPAQAILALEALTTTPLAGSIILLASFIAIDLSLRRHHKQSLRC